MNSLSLSVGLLAVATLEGVRHVPRDGIVFRQLIFGRWRAGPAFHMGRGLAMVSWCLPLQLPVVAVAGTNTPAFGSRRLVTRASRRLRRVGGLGAYLRIQSLVMLALLVLYVPYTALHWSSYSGIRLLSVWLFLLASQVNLTFYLLRSCGSSARSAASRCVGLLNPFAVHRAPEIVYAEAFRGVPRLAVAAILLGVDGMVQQLRRETFDAVHGEPDGAEVRWLEGLWSREELVRALGSTSQFELGTPFCPRCGAAYRPSAELCAECPSVFLVRG
ncbi:MAG: hypothetical protein U0132_08265 [Gemmatimonadaceae bacterium]